MAFFSGFGQTYFVSIFGGVIRADLGLDHATYGSCYSVGTIASAVVLLWGGRLIDRVALWQFSMVAICGLGLAAGAISSVGSIAGLTLGFFAVRLFGQGLMSHTAMTTMGRYFDRERGRAVSVAVTGHVAGGALLPLAGVALMQAAGWRNVWLIAGATLLLATAPVVALLLARVRSATKPGDLSKGRDDRAAPGTAAAAGGASDAASSLDWTPAEVLRDRGLYARLGVLLAPAFITTGLIFHQVHIGGLKGWSLGLIASGLSFYALGSFLMTITGGALVDRFGARRMVPVALAPLALCCVVLAVASSATATLAYFLLMGLGGGMSQILAGAIWAELYGVRHLGAIRAIAASGSVFSSGLAPGLFGILFDIGWGVVEIAAACAGYCVLASVIAWLFRAPPRRAVRAGS